jgi:ubiquitin-like 1-activating enzyme E1 B
MQKPILPLFSISSPRVLFSFVKSKMSRYSNLIQVYGKETFEKIRTSKICCVGAGGIGSELLKNLCLSGFEYIEIIDLDTIDVSNLNRQFLFRHQHVGKSKAEIAKETALSFNPNCKIIAYHGNIKDNKFGLEYFKQFSIVFNALDNVDARKHVNRMCLAADVVLIDGGTAGYLGQVTTIKKGETECYECVPKASAKSFAVCTIRSNPSTLVHCVVWAKLLFERLFGKEDDNNAITSFEGMMQHDKDFERVIFAKVFDTDIVELTKMKEKSVWAQNKAPQSCLIPHTLNMQHLLDDHVVWSYDENVIAFLQSCVILKTRRQDAMDVLTFDKDDEIALTFVTAAANLRATNFWIDDKKSKFEIKAIAGNIVPAISTTNAIIAGLLIQEAIKVLNDELSKTRVVHCLRNTAMVKRKPCLLYPLPTPKPNKDCYVCQSKYVNLRLNINKTTLGYFIESILKKNLTLLYPMIVAESNLIYECGDDIEGEDAEMYSKRLTKTLSELGMEENTTLTIEDFFQDINWTIILTNKDEDVDLFEIQGKMNVEKPIETNVTEEVVVKETLKRKDRGDEPEILN